MANKQRTLSKRLRKYPMPKYDELNFNPPAPIASVELQNLETGESITNVSMLMDTGADVSFLSRSIINLFSKLDFVEEDYELESFDGSRSKAKAVELQLIFLNKKFSGKFLLGKQETGILGRDVFESFNA